ncbi:hypothetical protein DL93DRAFT_2090838 [Clavulina sp. PMI_390]|nr:hypothetical protein DL93DRAFT_2090838 [Clavulina sp. PMI_390]
MRWPVFALVFHVFIVLVGALGPSQKREISRLTTKQLRALSNSPNPIQSFNLKSTTSHLSKILIPRAPDTANNTFVRNYLADTLRSLNWHVEVDSFTDNTPYGTKQFANVIATKDPKAPRKLIIAAHFDSKYFPSFPENQFLGATDSAFPCALMLDLAEALNPLLDAKAERLSQLLDDDEANETSAPETTLQLLFLDGEEAFKEWTKDDSIYGARHLAARWDSEYASTPSFSASDRSPTILETIEHFVLLDLLGAKDPLVSSSYHTTQWLFEAMIDGESRLEKAGLGLKPSRKKKSTEDPTPRTKPQTNEDVGRAAPAKSFFRPVDSRHFGFIEDDHIPFLHRGVSVLHIITNPFPRVWHTIKDDASALHAPTMRKWNLIMRIFVAEYLGLVPVVNGTSTLSTMENRGSTREGDLE